MHGLENNSGALASRADFDLKLYSAWILVQEVEVWGCRFRNRGLRASPFIRSAAGTAMRVFVAGPDSLQPSSTPLATPEPKKKTADRPVATVVATSEPSLYPLHQHPEFLNLPSPLPVAPPSSLLSTTLFPPAVGSLAVYKNSMNPLTFLSQAPVSKSGCQHVSEPVQEKRRRSQNKD